MSKRNNKEYNEYINSPQWQRKRLQCFNRFGRHCHLCGSTKKLHVHHKTYKRFKKEDVEKDLIPLCEKHHNALHKFCTEYNLDIWHGSVQYITHYLRPKKKENRNERLVIKKKKKTKKTRVVKNSEADIEKFKQLLSEVKETRDLPFEEQLRLMRLRIAERKEAKQKKKPENKQLSKNQLRKRKRYERLKKKQSVNEFKEARKILKDSKRKWVEEQMGITKNHNN